MISYWGVEHGVSKSYVPGKGWKPANQLTPKQRAKVPGAHQGAKGVSASDEAWRKQHSEVKDRIASLPPGMLRMHKAPGSDIDRAGTYRVGGKKTGRSIVMGQAPNGRQLKKLLRHEDQHAKVQRSSYRMHNQIASSGKKMMREEARADQLGGGRPWRKAGSGDSMYAVAAKTQRRARKKPKGNIVAQDGSVIPNKTAAEYFRNKLQASMPHSPLKGKKGDQAIRGYGKLRDKIAASQKRRS